MAFSSLLDRWGSWLEKNEMSPCKVSEEEQLFNVVECNGKKIAFSTLFIPSDLIGSNSLSLVIEQQRSPIWVRTYENIEGANVAVFSRMIATPEIKKMLRIASGYTAIPKLKI